MFEAWSTTSLCQIDWVKLELAKTSSFCEQIFQSEFLKDSAAICFSSRFVAFGSDEDQHEVSWTTFGMS